MAKVYIVDDDKEVRDAITLLMKSVGLKSEVFESAKDFLAYCNEEMIGCIVLDVRMPGLSGLDLQQMLIKNTYCPPIIIISGHGDISMAVRAVKKGAVDFIEKPFNDQVLLDSVHKALEIDVANRGIASKLNETEAKLALLTPREQAVLQLVIKGKRNKIIANSLSISASTVEAHRAKVMEKMQAKSLSELMRMVILIENS